MGLQASEIARLIGLGAPILCLDTCSILDVMRDPTRDRASALESKTALDLIVGAENGPSLVALIADQVNLEFNEHADRVQEETRQALERLSAKMGRIDSVAAVYGAVAAANLAHLDGHAARARAVVDRWVAATTNAPQSIDIPARALIRLNQAKTPARKGKDSMKDCVVIETYLEAVSRLRAGGLASKVVFLSSNTNDYAGETGSQLKSDLAAEFTALGMEYAPNYGAAKYMLGL